MASFADFANADAYFVVRVEGGDYEWLSFVAWQKASPEVPIFGVLKGNDMLIYDRILERLGNDPWRHRSLMTEPVSFTKGDKVRWIADDSVWTFMCEMQGTRPPVAQVSQPLEKPTEYASERVALIELDQLRPAKAPS